MTKKENQSLFQKLTKLFRSGPVVKRKLRSLDTTIAVPDKTKSSGALLFQKSMSPTYATITANAYNLSERLMRYQDFCFSGDTLVATPDEEGSARIDDIVRRWNEGDTNIWTFSFDILSKTIVSSKVTGAKCNGVKKVITVTLDDGSKIRCTPDHRFMLKDSSYVEAQNLLPGTALMRFSRANFSTPYRYVQTHGRGWKPEHVLVAEASAGRHCLDGAHVHHRNFKHRDNRPHNLEIMSAHDHMSLHAKINNLRFADPKERAKQSKIMKRRWQADGDLRKNLQDTIEKCRDGNRQRRIFFNKTFKPGRFNSGRKDQVGCANGNADKDFSYQDICNAFQQSDTVRSLSAKLGVSEYKIRRRLEWEGYANFSSWSAVYENHKVVSVVDEEEFIDVYDIEVAGYSNFALAKKDVTLGSQGIVIVHNCEMEYTPELAAAMDIYADETVAQDDKGRSLHIYSDNEKIREILEDLFYNTLNVEFNLRSWARNLVKYGDFFLYNDVSPTHGVVNAFPIPVNEIEREENFDPNDPMAVRYRWVTLGNRTMENWEVTHFRLLGNDMFLPYGSSIIEPARRIWRQLILIEDAMLVYRVVRAPERRVFYIDVANIPPENVPMYVEEQRKNLRSSQVVDRTTGRVDLRYNPLCHFGNDYIYLCDGTKKTFVELSENWNSYKDNTWAWSLDKNHHVIPTRLLWAGKTIESTKFVEVELDDGQIIRTTSDHKWMTRDGVETKAKDLLPGTSMMPFYTKTNHKLTNRHGDKDNRYIDIYDPSVNKYVSAHRLSGLWKYDECEWPNVIHHVNHRKCDNRPENLVKMTQSEHAKLHNELIVSYNKSAKGRINSSNTMKKTWKAGKINSGIFVDLWKNENVRKKRVDSLTCNVDSRIIGHIGTAINVLGTSVREYQVRDYLNGSDDFKTYMTNLNPNFKNGFNDKLTKGTFLKILRKFNFENLRDVKDYVVSVQAPFDRITSVCLSSGYSKRKQIENHFCISKYDLTRTILKNGLTVKEFDVRFLGGGYYGKTVCACNNCKKTYESNVRNSITQNGRQFCSKNCYDSFRKVNVIRRNHKIVSVKITDWEAPAYGVTVENSTHVIAIGGEGSQLANSNGVFLLNSVDEDYFIAVRGGDSGTKIDTLAGGQNTAAVEDVAYIQKKLFAALKIPRAYLGYDEALSCVVPETPVDLLDGRTLTVEQIKGELDIGKPVWVYSVDKETLKMKPGRVVWAGPTRKNASLVRVTIDNGMSFDCTPDHKWMLRDGSWCQAGELKPDTSLMPVERRLHSMNGGRDYEQIFDPASGKWKWTHRLVADNEPSVASDPSCLDESVSVIHHIDVNRFNNNPENLIRMGFDAHRQLHADDLAKTRSAALLAGKYNGLNNGWAKQCREKVSHLWNIQTLISWCLENHPTSKRQVMSGYGLRETQLDRLLLENSLNYQQFADSYVHGGYKLARSDIGGYKNINYKRINGKKGPGSLGGKFIVAECVYCNSHIQFNVKMPKKFCSSECHKYFGNGKKAPEPKFVRDGLINHKVISVELLTEKRDTWCIEVAGTHTFGLSKSVIISNSKATLAQEDIRFSRTINVIQKTLISELNKLAIIHLYANGFDEDDLQNFTLRLSNPSTIAQQQKLELWRSKFEIAGSAPEGQMSKEFIRKEIWGLNDEQCKQIDEQRLKEKMVDGAIEAAKPEEDGAAGGDTAATPPADDAGGGDEPAAAGGEEAAGEDLFAGDDPADDNKLDVLLSGDDPDDENYPVKFKLTDINIPVKPQSQLKKALYNRGRHRHHGPATTHMPDFNKSLNSLGSMKDDPTDQNFRDSYVSNPFGESKTLLNRSISAALQKMSQSEKFKSSPMQPDRQVLSEDDMSREEDTFIDDGSDER